MSVSFPPGPGIGVEAGPALGPDPGCEPGAGLDLGSLDGRARRAPRHGATASPMPIGEAVASPASIPMPPGPLETGPRAPSDRRRTAPRPLVAEASGWVPNPSSGTGDLIAVTSSDVLREEIERVASAAVRRLVVVSDPEDPVLLDAPVVLLGSDVAFADRSGRERVAGGWAATVIVGLAGEGSALWEAATRWGADRVAVLPEAGAWLVDALAGDAPATVNETRGRLVGVVGACGGAGATTLAVAVAHTAARTGLGGLLVDVDPLGPGIDVVLDGRGEPGVRWPDVSGAVGRIPGEQLRDAVPHLQDVPVLTGDAPPPGARIIPTVAAAARAAFPITVIDVGRDTASVHAWAGVVDTIALVLPAKRTASMAAIRVLDIVPRERVLVVVPGRGDDHLDPEELAASIGVSHVLVWPTLPAASRRLHAGRPLSDLVGRRCRAPQAVLGFARGADGP